MKQIIILIFLVFISCTSQKNANKNNEEKLLYEVYKIDSLKNYFLIYAKNKDLIFKIVSKKDVSNNCEVIKTNHKYPFILKSNNSLAPVINGVKMSAVNVDCYAFDKETTICIEKNNGIYDLYFADNIKGLCFIAK